MLANLKPLRIFSAGTRALARTLLGLLALWFAVACGSQRPEENRVEIPFREAKAEPSAVSEMLALVSPSHQLTEENVSPAQQILFTYLARTDPVDLVTTAAHSEGKWRVERVFILDDCVAVEMSEGHYLETLFFVQNVKGWRLTGRIRPADHQ